MYRNAAYLVGVVVLGGLLPLRMAAAGDLSLLEAVKTQNRPVAQALLMKRGIDVNVAQPDGATALHWAAHWDDLETTTLLLRAGARVNVANEFGVTPLTLACENGSAAMIERLLEAGADPRAVPSSGETPLMTAVRTGRLDAVTALMTRLDRSDVNAVETTEGQTPLMWAVGEAHGAIARVLLEHGADVRARSKSGFTPLLFAARAGDREAVEILLGAGSDVNELASDGTSVLLVAMVRGHVPLALFLLDHGADAKTDRAGYTPLHWAVSTIESELTGPFGISADSGEWSSLRGIPDASKLEMVNALLAHGADPNARMHRAEVPRLAYGVSRLPGGGMAGGTPFLLAAKAANVSMMRRLVAAGADPLLPTSGGSTPLMFAAGYARTLGESVVSESRALEAVKLSLEMGADVNAVNSVGETALHGAAYQGRGLVAQFLVEHGANVNAQNKLGATPLYVAEGHVYNSGGYQPHPETAEVIRKLGGIAPHPANEDIRR